MFRYGITREDAWGLGEISLLNPRGSSKHRKSTQVRRARQAIKGRARMLGKEEILKELKLID